MPAKRVLDVSTPINIIYVSPEVAPFSKFGGVADVAWALPKALKRLGHDVKIITPKFGTIDVNRAGITLYKENLVVHTEKKDIVCNVYKGIIPDDIEVFLIENMEYYELRANVYGYTDDARRFGLLSKAAIELMRTEEWDIHIVHVNDWETAYISDYIATEYKNDPKINKIASVFTIHNLAYQGVVTKNLKQSEIDQGTSPLPDLLSDRFLLINPVLRGIIYSDVVNTVSERYSKEILTPEQGEGMDKVLQEMRHKLTGIRNGVDYDVLSPDIDKNIYINYDVNSLEKKRENKIAFQREFDMNIDPDVPLVGFVGRFVDQKGIGLLHNTIRPLLDNLAFQFAIVGGDNDYWENYFKNLIKDYPGRVGGYLMISTSFAQKLYSACDIFIYPSLYEPCGVAHAIAMRFGAVPIVRETGGLADSVIDYNKDSKRGDGFMFKEYNDMALLTQMVHAITLYRTNKAEWKKIQYRAMTKDLSWGASAHKYVDLYIKAIDRHDKWMKKEGLIMAEHPAEVPGYSAIDILS